MRDITITNDWAELVATGRFDDRDRKFFFSGAVSALSCVEEVMRLPPEQQIAAWARLQLEMVRFVNELEREPIPVAAPRNEVPS